LAPFFDYSCSRLALLTIVAEVAKNRRTVLAFTIVQYRSNNIEEKGPKFV
jgi:hypothetical protein